MPFSDGVQFEGQRLRVELSRGKSDGDDRSRRTDDRLIYDLLITKNLCRNSTKRQFRKIIFDWADSEGVRLHLRLSVVCHRGICAGQTIA